MGNAHEGAHDRRAIVRGHELSRGILAIEQDLIGNQQYEAIVSDKVPRGVDRVAEAARRLLLDKMQIAIDRRAIEVVANHLLAAADDDADVRQAGADRLIDDAMDDRPVAEGKELLRYDRGHRHHARPDPGGGNDGLLQHSASSAGAAVRVMYCSNHSWKTRSAKTLLASMYVLPGADIRSTRLRTRAGSKKPCSCRRSALSVSAT